MATRLQISEKPSSPPKRFISITKLTNSVNGTNNYTKKRFVLSANARNTNGSEISVSTSVDG